MNRKSQKILSLFLAVCMTLTMVPMSAFALEDTQSTGNGAQATATNSGCICDSLCNEGVVNAACPMCAADIAACSYIASKTRPAALSNLIAMIDALPSADEITDDNRAAANTDFEAVWSAYEALFADESIANLDEALGNDRLTKLANLRDELSGTAAYAANLSSYNINSASVVINDSCGATCPGHTITGIGSITTNTITVSGGSHKITLNNVHIDTGASATQAPFLIASGAGDVELTLTGSNALYATGKFAALQKENTAWLTVTSTSSGLLGASSNNSATTSGAAIGGAGYTSASHIRINGGTLMLETYGGSGIGGGAGGDGSDIEINGGAITFDNHGLGACIGGGQLAGSHTGTGKNIIVTGGTMKTNSFTLGDAALLVGNGDKNTVDGSNKIAPAAGTCAKIVYNAGNNVGYNSSTTQKKTFPSLSGCALSFVTEYHTLTVTNGTGSNGYLSDAPAIAITANPAPAKQKFSHWKVTSGSATIANASSASTTLSMLSDATVEAVYGYDFDNITVGITPASLSVEKGTTHTLGLWIKNAAGEAVDSAGFTVQQSWSVSGGLSGTSINNSGVLTIAADETASALTVSATVTLSKDGMSKTYTPTAHAYLGEQTAGDLVIVGAVPGTDYTTKQNSTVPDMTIITFTGSGDYLIKMKTGVSSTINNKIIISGGTPTITLSDVQIKVNSYVEGSPLAVDGCQATLKLEGTNSLTATGSNAPHPGVKIINGATLEITSASGNGKTDGKLTAKGYRNPGIGTQAGDSNVKHNALLISGGTIIATGSSELASGIGSGYSATNGLHVTITGGDITASGYRAIGDGYRTTNSGTYKITPAAGMQANVQTDGYHYYVGETPYADAATSAHITFGPSMTMSAQVVADKTTATSAVLKINPSEAADYYYKLYKTQQTDMAVDKVLSDDATAAKAASGSAASGSSSLTMSGLQGNTTYYGYIAAKSGTDGAAKVSAFTEFTITTPTLPLTLEGTLAASGTYGQALSAITPTGGTVKDNAGNVIAGKWTFQQSDAASLYPVVKGSATYTATFTPNTNPSDYAVLTKEVTPTMSYLGTTAAATASPANGNKWYSAAFTLTAPTGFTISAANTLPGTWGDSISHTTEGKATLTYYLKETETGLITEKPLPINWIKLRRRLAHSLIACLPVCWAGCSTKIRSP